MEHSLRIGVGGVLGRMGVAVSAMVSDRAGAVLVGGFDRNPPTARDEILAGSDVVIDFSTGPATAALAEAAGSRGEPALVIGATGLSDEENAVVAAAATRIAIVQSGNYSVGVNVLAGLVEQAARRLSPEIWDIEILEAHHRRKADAPSGTALMLARAAARGRGKPLADLTSPPRDGMTGPRPRGVIALASVRGGGIVGDHSVMFAAEEEIITLSHSARDRALFARGAVEAALWVAGRPPGLYDMVDVLGFREGPKR
jgi:4-hydroxy-tetrahydrodipicolinate reductase